MKNIVELEAQLRGDIGIGALLVRQTDVQTDAAAAAERGSPIGGLHDSRSAAGDDQEPMPRAVDRLRPLRDQARQLAGFAVVAAQRPLLLDPGRSEEGDGVVDAVAAEGVERLEILGENPDLTPLVAVQERRIAIGERRSLDVRGRFGL